MKKNDGNQDFQIGPFIKPQSTILKQVKIMSPKSSFIDINGDKQAESKVLKNLKHKRQLSDIESNIVNPLTYSR